MFCQRIVSNSVCVCVCVCGGGGGGGGGVEAGFEQLTIANRSKVFPSRTHLPILGSVISLTG